MMAARTESPARGKELSIEGHKDALGCESSDEDDDGIPSRVTSISPSKYMVGPSLRLASVQPNRKRSFHTFTHDRRSSYPDTLNKLEFYPGLSKRRRVDNWTDTRSVRTLPTPTSSHPAHIVLGAPSRHESTGSSAEDDAPEDVLFFLNSALHLTSQGEPRQYQRQESPSTDRQPRSEPSEPSEPSQEGECTDKTNVVNGDEEQELENPSRTTEPHLAIVRKSENVRKTNDPGGDVRGNGGSNFATAGNMKYPLELDGLINKHIAVEANLEEDGEALAADSFEVSGSLEEPKQSYTGRPDVQSFQQFSPAGGEVEESNKPLRRSNRIRSAASRSQQAPEPQVLDPPPKTTPEEDGDYSEEGGQGNKDNNCDGDNENDIEAINGFEADEEEKDEADIDLSAEESFEQDVKHFRSLRVVGTDKVKNFEGPPDDDLTAIHLDYQPLRRVCKLMANRAWTGRKVDWQWRPFNCDDAVTLPGRTILSLLVKLERLYHAAPDAPKLMEQNRFLREYSDLLSYYFSKIQLVVEHIRTERLASPERNTSSLNIDDDKRKEMAEELIHLIIPMLLHVLASAWRLGGRNWSQTSFTSSTTELLKRAVRWIMFLCSPLLKELRRSPLEEEPSLKTEQSKWRKKNARREELSDLMESLVQVIRNAPDMLEREENRAARELEDRRRWLRRQGEMQAQRKLEEEAKLRSIEDQKLRSLMSIRGVYYPLGSSPPPPSPSPPRKLPASSAASFYRPPQWSFEEKVFLFKNIQESYPVLPNLKSLRLEVGKTVSEMEDMAEELLEVMLETVEPEETAESRSAEVQEIMQNYRLAHGR